MTVRRPLPIPEPATTVAVLVGDGAQALTEHYARLGARIVGDGPADLVIADADLTAASRRVQPGGTLAVLAPAELESAPLVLAEIDVIVCIRLSD